MGGVGHIMGGCGIGDGVGHIMGCCGTEDGAGHSIMDGSGTEACIGSKDEGGNQDEGSTPRSSSPWSCSLASLFFSRMASHLLLLISFEDGGGAEDEGGAEAEGSTEDEGGIEDEGGNQDEGVTEDESGTPRFPSPWS